MKQINEWKLEIQNKTKNNRPQKEINAIEKRMNALNGRMRAKLEKQKYESKIEKYEKAFQNISAILSSDLPKDR